MSYLKSQSLSPVSSGQLRKIRNNRKKYNESIINIEDLTLDKRLNPVPAQPWLRRPEKFYECFSISGPLSAKQGTKCETLYSYPKQQQDFLSSYLPFCFPEGLNKSPKKYNYSTKKTKSFPKYSALIGSEIEHFIFMLTNYESLLYGYCIKVWYPFGFLPSFVKKGHPIFQRKPRSRSRNHSQQRKKFKTTTTTTATKTKKPRKEMRKSQTTDVFITKSSRRKTRKQKKTEEG